MIWIYKRAKTFSIFVWGFCCYPSRGLNTEQWNSATTHVEQIQKTPFYLMTFPFFMRFSTHFIADIFVPEFRLTDVLLFFQPGISVYIFRLNRWRWILCLAIFVMNLLSQYFSIYLLVRSVAFFQRVIWVLFDYVRNSK